MSALHASVAAARGFDLLRREPRAAAIWCGLLAASAVVGGLIGKATPAAQVGGLLLDLLASLAVMGAAYRAWMRPEARAGAYLRLGADERRLMVQTLVMAAPGLLVVPALRGGVGSPLALVALALAPVWLWWALRFSLAGAAGFAAGRLQLRQGWAMARGKAFKLALAWALVMVFIALSAAGLGFIFMILNAMAAFISGAKVIGALGPMAILANAALQGMLGAVGLVLFVGVAVTAHEAATTTAEV